MTIDLDAAMIEREPVTIICSHKGWIKAMKGHGQKTEDVKYKDGDRGRFVIEAQTTDKLLVFGTNGRFYTLSCNELPPGRGFGEPVRLMVDLPNEADIAGLILYEPDRRLIVASSDGRGFVVKSEDVLAQTKSGKQILNVSGKVEAMLAKYLLSGDNHIAVIGQSRKMLVFALDELPEMARGKGVILQKYKDGGLSDMKSFSMQGGLEFKYGSGITLVEDVLPWIGKRASAGRLPPNGFPKNNKFD
jgi:topoisomerase-4 subunit A